MASIATTPGWVGGVAEAALVTGLVGVGVATPPAVAGVLMFRLLTFWIRHFRASWRYADSAVTEPSDRGRPSDSVGEVATYADPELTASVPRTAGRSR